MKKCQLPSCPYYLGRLLTYCKYMVLLDGQSLQELFVCDGANEKVVGIASWYPDPLRHITVSVH